MDVKFQFKFFAQLYLNILFMTDVYEVCDSIGI